MPKAKLSRTLGPAWGYIRISEPEKRRGQNPKRQEALLRAWCEREKVPLRGVTVDDGKSATKFNPFERPVFRAAVKQALEAGCVAIVVEQVDRFCRQGSKVFGYASVLLEQDHGLMLWVATHAVQPQLEEDFSVEVQDALAAAVARKAMKDHGARVASGMAQRALEGKRMGRPRKLSDAEKVEVRRLAAEEGWGVRRIARHLSEQRGAFKVADQAAPKARRLRVGQTVVWEALRGK